MLERKAQQKQAKQYQSMASISYYQSGEKGIGMAA